MYGRIIKKPILDNIFKGKVILIIGARQVGKTTLVKQITEEFKDKKIIFFNCDNPTDREKLDNRDLEELEQITGNKEIIVVDEAQKVATIGQTLKLMVDKYGKNKQIIATGSSSINLLDKTEEPLTGRKRVWRLYPLSIQEIYPEFDLLKIEKELETRLIYGSYPEVVSAKDNREKKEILTELLSSYLFKDILEFQAVKNSTVLFSLIKALALQIGSEISYNELSSLIGLEKSTIERYVDLLEKNYILFRLPPYSANKRRTISKLRKIYFYDLGIRNAIIDNFNPLDARNDSGFLWENFAIVERIKRLDYLRKRTGVYFLRTYDGAEIDLVEESGGVLKGYEFKRPIKRRKSKREIAGIKYEIISPKNIKDFYYNEIS